MILFPYDYCRNSSGKTDISGQSSKAKGTATVKSILSSETKSTPISESKTVQFKARTMPNFKALHDKIPLKSTGTPLADKENSGAHCNKALVPLRRQSLKGLWDKRQLSALTINILLNYAVNSTL
jgi:hypothetical protein